MSRVIMAIVVVSLGLGCAGHKGGDKASTDPVYDSATSTTWAAQTREAVTALELGDRRRVRRAIRAMEEERPHHPLPGYFRARLAETDAAWGEALRHYQEILGSPATAHSSEWRRLVTGRWVRARRCYDEGRVRAAMARPGSQSVRPGRCLVLPLEPMLLEDSGGAQAEELEALGLAVASWVIAGLARVSGAEPVGLHAVFLLKRAMAARGGPIEGGAGIEPAAEDEPAPPITTILGAAHRLASLAPAGAPPGRPEGERPARYLEGALSGEWTESAARSLAHFQAEHGLPATGILDPETRRTLERAYRKARRTISVPPPEEGWHDPSLAMGQLLGAKAVLTGTLESQGPETVRWNVAWVSPEDGSLLADPIEGVLPTAHFREAWDRMLRLMVEGSPPCSRSAECARITMPEPPERGGALDCGLALQLVEEQSWEEAAFLFERAVRNGAGERASWYAAAWSTTPEELDVLERSRVREAIFGTPRLEAGLLQRESLLLTYHIFRGFPEEAAAGPGIGWDSGLTYFPEMGWISVIGELEGE